MTGAPVTRKGRTMNTLENALASEATFHPVIGYIDGTALRFAGGLIHAKALEAAISWPRIASTTRRSITSALALIASCPLVKPHE